MINRRLKRARIKELNQLIIDAGILLRRRIRKRNQLMKVEGNDEQLAEINKEIRDISIGVHKLDNEKRFLIANKNKPIRGGK